LFCDREFQSQWLKYNTTKKRETKQKQQRRENEKRKRKQMNKVINLILLSKSERITEEKSSYLSIKIKQNGTQFGETKNFNIIYPRIYHIYLHSVLLDFFFSFLSLYILRHTLLLKISLPLVFISLSLSLWNSAEVVAVKT
jgi:hypothetical protein